MIIFLFLVITLIVSQNLLAVGLSKLLQLNPLVGMCTGSIPMVGGHGTAGAFGPVLEDFNIQGATTICTAAATFGLIMGSLIGGPIGKRLIEKRNLMDTVATEDDSLLIEEKKSTNATQTCMQPCRFPVDFSNRSGNHFFLAAYQNRTYFSDLYWCHACRSINPKYR